MSARKVALVTTAAAMVLLVLIAAPGGAHTATKTDPNDTKGPLDLRSVKVTHDTSTLTFTLTTFTTWKATDLGQTSYFLIAIDRNEDDVADRCGFIYSAGAKLRGQLTNCKRNVIDGASVSRPSPKTARIVISVADAGSTHQWAAYSRWDEGRPCERPCVDSIPNRRPLFHDLDPPHVAWVSTVGADGLSTELSSTTTVPLQISTSDAETRVAGYGFERLVNDVWTPFEEGVGTGVITHNVQVSEGAWYLLRPYAVDAHGNVSTEHPWLEFNVPYDDANVAMVFSGGWTTSTPTGAYEGTAHTSSTVGASVTVTIPQTAFRTSLRILGGPGDGSASIEINGVSYGTLSEVPSEPWLTEHGVIGLLDPPSNTITITVTSGTVVIDGLAAAVV